MWMGWTPPTRNFSWRSAAPLAWCSRTVVLITHHMDEAAQADRLVVMAKGRVIADGAPKEIFQDVEGLKAVGLTVPETTQLLWELRREGLDVPLDALSDEECAQALKELLA